MPFKPGNNSRTVALTGLRGVAAAWVFLHHLWHQSAAPPLLLDLGLAQIDLSAIARAGFLGVDLFFVLSGLLLGTAFALHQRGEGPAVDLREFWRRRALRVLPAYGVQIVILFAAIWIWTGVAPMGFWRTLSQFLLLQNLWPDYDEHLNRIHWSLPVEWNFYMVLPIVALAFRSLRTPVVVCAALGLALAFRLFCFWYVWRYYPPDGLRVYTLFMQLPGRIDLFMVGVAAGLWVVSNDRPRPWLFVSGLAATVALVLVAGTNGSAFLDVATPWSMVTYSLAGPAFALLLCGAAAGGHLVGPLLENRAIVFLGVISYSLYLWHTVPMRAADAITERSGTALSELGIDHFLEVCALYVPIAIALSYASWRFVERPLISERTQ
jgi:peptidoglycan/LPS O-acetylase OafA/YrhL